MCWYTPTRPRLKMLKKPFQGVGVNIAARPFEFRVINGLVVHRTMNQIGLRAIGDEAAAIVADAHSSARRTFL